MIAIVAPIAGLAVIGGILLMSTGTGDSPDTQYTTFGENVLAYYSHIVGAGTTDQRVINVNDNKFFSKLKKRTSSLTVVLFYWKSCGACKRFNPYWNALVTVMSHCDCVNLVAVERADMDSFFANKGKAGGSVHQFPTMRVIDGTKQIAAYDNDANMTPPLEIQQQIIQKYAPLLVRAQQYDIQVDRPEKLMEMIMFVEDSLS